MAWHALLLDGATRFPSAFLLSAEEAAAMDGNRIEGAMASGTIYGLDTEDGLIGIAGLHVPELPRIRHRAVVGPFYVAPHRHGTGAADAFMDGLAEIARGRGAAWIDLWVAASNGRARAFYARHGFVEMGTRDDAVRLDGRSEDDVAMARRLEAGDAAL